MRQIIFRAKRKDNGEWVEGDYIASDYISPWRNGELYINKGYYDGMEWGEGSFYRIDPNTVGQYTGLTDKNGKKIFEGDIVKIVGEVIECITDEDTVFTVSYKTKGEHACGFGLLDCFEYEIIGNIHDNKEFDAQNGEEKEE